MVLFMGYGGQGTYFQRDHIPYRLQVLGWYMLSSFDFRHYGMTVDSYLPLSRLRLQAQLGERIDPLANYYGYGNKQDIAHIDKVVGTEESTVVPVGSNLVRDELINLGIRDGQNRYYNYSYKNLYSNVTLEDWIWKKPIPWLFDMILHFKWFLGISTNHYEVKSYHRRLEPSEREQNDYTYIDIEQPLGYEAIRDGEKKNVNLLRLALAYDSRDPIRSKNPNSGIVADLHFGSVGSWLGSDYSYSNLTFTWRQFVELFPSFWNKVDIGIGSGMESVFVYRIVIRRTFGTAPFFEAGKIRTTWETIDGLGGVNGIRGYPANQFVDKLITFANFELRHTFLKTNFLGGFDLQLAFFYDVGRVASSSGDWEFKDFHQAYGPSLTAIWQQSSVFALSFGFSQYQRFFSFQLNHAL